MPRFRDHPTQQAPERGDLHAAQNGDAAERERILAAYVPVAVQICSRVCGRRVEPGRDDEVSIALLALNEAIDSYRTEAQVPFRSFAETVVRRRLVDHFRRQKRVRELPFTALEVEQEDGTLYNPAEWSAAEAVHRDRIEREERQAEIAQYQEILRTYGITLDDLVERGPRHADARSRAIEVARAVATDQRWREYLRLHHALPLRELEAHPALDISRKTMERQRKYIIAVAVILMEDLHILRSYISTVS